MEAKDKSYSGSAPSLTSYVFSPILATIGLSLLRKDPYYLESAFSLLFEVADKSEVAEIGQFTEECCKMGVPSQLGGGWGPSPKN